MWVQRELKSFARRWSTTRPFGSSIFRVCISLLRHLVPRSSPVSLLEGNMIGEEGCKYIMKLLATNPLLKAAGPDDTMKSVAIQSQTKYDSQALPSQIQTRWSSPPPSSLYTHLFSIHPSFFFSESGSGRLEEKTTNLNRHRSTNSGPYPKKCGSM